MPAFLEKDGCYLGWFTGPITIDTGSATHVLSANTVGDINVTQYTHATGAVVTTTLAAAFEIDDHAPCALIERSDGRLIAFYAQHVDRESPVYYHISDNPGDSTSWGPQQVAMDNINRAWSYTWAFRLTAEGTGNGRIYIFSRDNENINRIYWSYSYSDDDGVNWTVPQNMHTLTNGSDNPYPVMCSNGVDRIDLAVTNVQNSQPLPAPRINVWHAYITGGSMYQSDGTLIGALTGGPYTVETSYTLAYDSTSDDDVWVVEIVPNGGNPAVCWIKYAGATPDVGHEYWESSWNGSAWEVPVKVSDAGDRFSNPGSGSQEEYYAPLMIFDDGDPTQAWCAIGDWQSCYIAHYSKTGSVWSEDYRLVAGQDRCVPFRPLQPYTAGTRDPRASLIINWGRYDDFTAYNCALSMFGTVADVNGSGWTRVAPMTVNGAQVTGGPHGDFTAVITEAQVPSDFWSLVKNGGGDVRFSRAYTESGGVYDAVDVLASEVVHLDTSGQTCEIWVSLPDLPSAGGDIHLWYGNAAADAPVQANGYGTDALGFPVPQSVWHPTTFIAVFHMAEASGNIIDASVHGNDSETFSGSPTYQATGIFGPGSGIDMFDNDAFDWSYSMPAAAEIWIIPANTNPTQESWPWVASNISNDRYRYIRVDNTGSPRASFAGQSTNPSVAQDGFTPIGVLLVHGVANRHLTTTSPSQVQVNNRSRVTGTGATFSSTNRTRVGGINRGSQVYRIDAIVDEIRAFQGLMERNEDYVSTEYLNGSAPATFWTAGTPIIIGTPPASTTKLVMLV